MKKSLIGLVVFASLALVLTGGYLLLWGDEDEKIINQNLARLVELAEKEGNESVFVTLGQSREIMRFIASDPNVELGAPFPLLTDRQELEGVIVQVRQTLQSLSIRIVSNELLVAEDGRSAQMEIEAEGNVAYLSESGRERRKFSIGWLKEDGDWLIQTVRLEGLNYQF